MNARQEAKFSMYRAVQTLCSNNQTLVNAQPAFATALTNFNTLVNSLFGAQNIVSQQTKGIAVDKVTLKKALAQTATDIAALVFAYANKTKNNTLKQLVNFAKSDIEKIKDDLIVSTCNNIKKAANDNLPSLVDYGVNTDVLIDFQTQIDAYNDVVPQPKIAKASKTTETANIKSIIKSIDDVLKNEMDKLVISFKNTNPKFVADYKNTRVIIDPSSTKKTPLPKSPNT